MRTLLVLLLLALAGGAAAYWYAGRPASVATILPARGDAAEIVYASGVVEPRHWAKVTSLIRERIVELCNCEGEAVAAGDVLARLNDREPETALAELQARLRLANDERQRLAVLVGRNAASQAALDRARSEVAQIEAQLAGQVARLESYVLRAPISGSVLRQDGEVGEIAEPGSVLFWVGQPSPRVVIADVNEEDIPRIAAGQPALLSSDAFRGRTMEAEVDHVTPMGDPLTRTYRVRFRLPDDTPLMIGMSVDVNVIVHVSENALLVPSLALDGSALFVVQDGIARRREVEVGIRGVRQAEILSGIPEHARVVTPFPDGMRDGARVTVARRE